VDPLRRGWEFLSNGSAFRVRRVVPPLVLSPVDEADGLSTNDAAQFALAAIQNLALIGDALGRRPAGRSAVHHIFGDRGTSGRHARCT
jgi:hypothetical protein